MTSIIFSFGRVELGGECGVRDDRHTTRRAGNKHAKKGPPSQGVQESRVRIGHQLKVDHGVHKKSLEMEGVPGG